MQSQDEIKDLKHRVDKLLSFIEDHIKDSKATVADYIRLIQLQRELEQQEQPAEVVVRWVEPSSRRDRLT